MTAEDVMKEMATGRHGHFAAALAEAWQLADSNNRWKIESAWSALIYKVSEMLRERQK